KTHADDFFTRISKFYGMSIIDKSNITFQVKLKITFFNIFHQNAVSLIFLFPLGDILRYYTETCRFTVATLHESARDLGVPYGAVIGDQRYFNIFKRGSFFGNLLEEFF